MNVFEDLEKIVDREAALRNHEVIVFLLQEGITFARICTHGRLLARRKKICTMRSKTHNRIKHLDINLIRFLDKPTHSHVAFHANEGYMTVDQIKNRIIEYEQKLPEYDVEIDELYTSMTRHNKCGQCPMCCSFKNNPFG